MITQNELKRIIHYCPDSGIFTWRVDRPPRGKAGNQAGYDCGHKYLRISFNGKYVYAHRLAFLYMTGAIPKEIDHINHNRADNRWINIRPATRTMNVGNWPGCKGIRIRYGKWYARFANYHIGVFDTKQAAANARKQYVISVVGLDPDAVYE